MNVRLDAGEISVRNEEDVLDRGQQAFLVIKWQKSGQSCILVLGGR